MNKKLSVKMTACNKYQRLLEECGDALEMWNQQRAENCRSRATGKETGDKLLRLQANFAGACAVLQNHAQNCSRCQWVSRIEGRHSENNSDAFSDSTLYV
jgi:hypothetical protein